MMDYFILMRPTLFLPVWMLFLLGAHFAQGTISLRSISIFILYTLLMGGIYVLNQIVDKESDKKNKKLFLLSDEIIPISHAYFEMIALFFLSLSLSIIFGKYIFIYFMISFFMGVTYSVPPFEIKARPFLDLIWNSIGYGLLAFIIGWISAGKPSEQMWIRGIPYLFIIGAVFSNTTLPDIKGDIEEGKITTGVFIGKRKTLILALILDIFAIILSYLFGDYICFILSVLSFPFFIYAVFDSQYKSILLSFRIPVVILAIEVSIITPIIIPLFITIFLTQKIYYKKKFNFNYPAFYSGMDKNV
jgi:4-hydroxybenzoate polyprenyltransferase